MDVFVVEYSNGAAAYEEQKRMQDTTKPSMFDEGPAKTGFEISYSIAAVAGFPGTHKVKAGESLFLEVLQCGIVAHR